MICAQCKPPPEPDGDANDCRVGVIGATELEGAAFMAYLGHSPKASRQQRAHEMRDAPP